MLILGEDRYYKDNSHLTEQQRKEQNYNYDEPYALDQALLATHLGLARQKKPFDLIRYDYQTKKVTIEEKQKTSSNIDVIIVEGLFLFFPPILREQFDLKIVTSMKSGQALCNRMARDVKERGTENVTYTLNGYLNIQEGTERYIKPTTHLHADIEYQNLHVSSQTTQNLVSKQQMEKQLDEIIKSVLTTLEKGSNTEKKSMPIEKTELIDGVLSWKKTTITPPRSPHSPRAKSRSYLLFNDSGQSTQTMSSNHQLAAAKGYALPKLYGKDQYSVYPDAQLLPGKGATYLQNAMERLRSLHQSHLSFKTPKAQQPLFLIMQESHKPVSVQKAIAVIKQDTLNPVPSHNNLHGENILLHRNTTMFQCWEYSGMNSPYWDVALLLALFNVDEKQNAQWLAFYNKGSTQTLNLTVFRAYATLTKHWICIRDAKLNGHQSTMSVSK